MLSITAEALPTNQKLLELCIPGKVLLIFEYVFWKALATC